MLIPADRLPELVFVGSKFDKTRFDNVNSHFRKKPSGGLWTSPIREGKSEWEHYMEGEKDKLYGYLMNHTNVYPQPVAVDPGAKVFLISSEHDADYLEDKYQWSWPRIEEDYDAVYVDLQGVIVMDEGKWDLPSVVFLNLDYVKVESNG